MTITTTEPRVLYTGNGSTTSFAVPFDFDTDADIKVDLIKSSNNEVEAQELATHYTVSGSNVVFSSAPSATQKILITLDVDMDQDSDYVSNGTFAAETLENDLDERVKQIKQLKHTIDYNVPKLPSNILSSSTVEGTDITADAVFGINSTADGVSLQKVEDIIDINELSEVGPQLDDTFIIADQSDSWTPKKVTGNAMRALFDSAMTSTVLQVDNVTQNLGAPTIDFVSSDFTVTKASSDNFDITINDEKIQDVVGSMVSSNTETGISVVYQDSDGTLDFTVSDLTVAGDSGSTGMTPGDTLTVVGGTEVSTSMSGDTLTISYTGNSYTDESIQDLVGQMVTGNTETGVTVTYEDFDGTLDFVVSDTTVAGDSGSTGITPGDTLTIAGGTNCTTAMSGDTLTVNVDDAFLSNTGDVGTGVYDFGGATSLEIPNGASPTVDAAGEIAVDTSIASHNGLIKYHDGTTEMVIPAIPAANLTTTDGHIISYSALDSGFTMGAASGGGGGGGGMTLLATATAASSATIDFDNVFDSTYEDYIVVVSSVVPSASSAALRCRVGTGATPTYQSGGSDYAYTYSQSRDNFGPGKSGSASTDHIQLGITVGNSTGDQYCGAFYIHSPSNSSNYTAMHGTAHAANNTSLAALHLYGRYNSNTAVTSLRFYFATGNVASGEFKLYGLKKTT